MPAWDAVVVARLLEHVVVILLALFLQLAVPVGRLRLMELEAVVLDEPTNVNAASFSYPS